MQGLVFNSTLVACDMLTAICSLDTNTQLLGTIQVT